MEQFSSQSVLIRFLDFFKEMMSADSILLFTCGRKKRLIYRGDSSVFASEKKTAIIQIIEQTLKRKSPVIFPQSMDNSSSFLPENPENQNGYSVLCLPMSGLDGLLGAVCLERCSSRKSFTDTNLDLMLELTKPLKHILRIHHQDILGENPGELHSESIFSGISELHRKIIRMIECVKNNYAPVFIWGESGTGKELVARTIHESGYRKQGQFVAVNCGAIPDHLLESEFFGHVRGAFTGAMRDKPGLVEEANGGTFFLDEIGDLSPALQSKLLRLLQEREFRRVGDNRTRRVDVRFISATNKNIEEQVIRGLFREDLYYRLKIITIEIPPLRDRKEDILYLLNRFLAKYSQEMNREICYFSPRCLELLINYSWPGNVRELQNEIQRCLILCGEDEIIREEYLSARVNPGRESHSPISYNYFQARAEFEKRFLNQALTRFKYNRARTAKNIGLSRQGLFKLIKKHNIIVPSERRHSEV